MALGPQHLTAVTFNSKSHVIFLQFLIQNSDICPISKNKMGEQSVLPNQNGFNEENDSEMDEDSGSEDEMSAEGNCFDFLLYYVSANYTRS